MANCMRLSLLDRSFTKKNIEGYRTLIHSIPNCSAPFEKVPTQTNFMYFNLRNPKNNLRMLEEPKPLKKKLNTFESKISKNIAPTAKTQTLMHSNPKPQEAHQEKHTT